MRHNNGNLFARVRDAESFAVREAFCRRALPDGKRVGHEYVARNPRRADRRPGSFKINLHTGRWADFASGDCGGDLASLAAYLTGLSQIKAAQHLADMLGVRND